VPTVSVGDLKELEFDRVRLAVLPRAEANEIFIYP
jgi:hypothetical protein